MRKVVRRQNKIELTAQKKDGENRPFCGVDLMSSLRYWPTRRDSQGRIAVFFNSTVQCGRCSEQNSFCERYIISLSLRSSPKGGADFGKRHKKKDGENRPFCGVDLMSSLRYWPTRRDSQGRIAVFFNSTVQCGRCSEQNSFCERYIISLSLRSSPKGGADFGKRHKKKDGENRPFCGVDLMSSLRNWSTRRDSNPKQCRRRA